MEAAAFSFLLSLIDVRSGRDGNTPNFRLLAEYNPDGGDRAKKKGAM